MAAEEGPSYNRKYVSSLSRVTFASGSALRRIGKDAFSKCKQLKEIEIPDGVQLDGQPGVRVRVRQ